MFIETPKDSDAKKQKDSGLKRNGQQFARGYFLVLVALSGKSVKETGMRAMIRYCSMSQMGHFMMGKIRCQNKSLTMKGTYGNNGLPVSVEEDIWDKCVQVPDELYDKWATGGGHNSAGEEGQDMNEWAKENFEKLRKAGS